MGLVLYRKIKNITQILSLVTRHLELRSAFVSARAVVTETCIGNCHNVTENTFTASNVSLFKTNDMRLSLCPLTYLYLQA